MEEPECPLCLEPLALDDINFFPCKCRYQICRFCWHRIRTNEGGKCPHCRTVYAENPVEYTPLSPTQIAKMKEKGKRKNQDKKQKIIESRKNLSEVRVIQKNLVFVLGLSPRLADPEVLKRQEYFAKFGKIYKVVINHHTVYNGTLGPSVSAYVTYQRAEDASKAIQAVNNAFIDGRYLKASYGTTKYCSFFLRGLQCTKPDCMYLHELGDEEASFTKEDMQQGKHQEYEVATLEATASLINSQETSTKPHHTKKNSLKGKLPPIVSSDTTTNKSESALPSSANWGTKSDKSRKDKSFHGQKHVDQWPQPHPLRSSDRNHHTRNHLLCNSEESLKIAGSGNVSELLKQPIATSDSSRRHSSSVVSISSDASEHDYENVESVASEDSESVKTDGLDEMTKDTGWNDNSTVNGIKEACPSPGLKFGFLGVNWKGHHSLSTESGDTAEYMSLPWDMSSDDGDKSTLVSLLGATNNPCAGSPLRYEGCVDEKQRLASASYVNYGPTTNNPLDEPRKVSHDKTHLNEGNNNVISYASSHSSLESAIEASSLSSSRNLSNLFNVFRQSSGSGGADTVPEVSSKSNFTNSSSKQWSVINSSATSPSPPPGFRPQKSTGDDNTYSLWGEKANSTLQELFKQQDQGSNRSLPSTIGQRPVPAGAISHNVLEASMFSSGDSSIQQQQQQQALKHQQQRKLALQQQQQQQRYQQQVHMNAALQQQLLMYQQQLLNSQHKHQTSMMNQPLGNHSSQYMNKQHDIPLYSYFGGWYPAAYTWGVPQALTVNTSPASSSSSAGSRKVPAGGGRSGSSNQAVPALEQKIHNLSFK